jgi:hypothetical protein
MAAVLNRATKEFKASAHTPNYSSVEWIINPDLSAVQGQPKKYWMINGDVVTLATPAEQIVIDDALAATRATKAKEEEKNRFDNERLLKAFAELVLDQFNTLRAIEGLPDLTFAQLRTAIRDKIDVGAN